MRGVDCGGVLDTLTERRLTKIAGRKDAPGRPMVYATTPEFLETFGLKDLEQLPDLGELREIDAAIGQMSAATESEIEMSPQLELPEPDVVTPSEENSEQTSSASPDESSEET